VHAGRIARPTREHHRLRPRCGDSLPGPEVMDLPPGLEQSGNGADNMTRDVKCRTIGDQCGVLLGKLDVYTISFPVQDPTSAHATPRPSRSTPPNRHQPTPTGETNLDATATLTVRCYTWHP
jgi:hypothetical protein